MKVLSTRASFLFSIIVFCNLIPGNSPSQKVSARSIENQRKQARRDPIPRQDKQTKAELDRYCPDKNERGAFCSDAFKNGCNALLSAAESGDLNEVRSLLEKGVDVNAKLGSGHTALVLAAIEGHLDIVKALLRAGADPNVKMYSLHAGEFSALMSAMDRCNKDWLQITDAMIAAGAEVNPKGGFSRSPLMYAIERHDVVMIKALLTRDADANSKNELDFTPLMTATTSSTPSIEVVKLLLAAGADANARSTDGQTALSLLDTYSKDKTIHDQIARLLKSKP
jgi:ankyrin repeat protein